MKIMISPAKRMKEWELTEPKGTPVFQREAMEIAAYMKALSYEELKQVLKCKEKLARQAYVQYQDMERAAAFPALLAYDGIQYQYMASRVLEEEQYAYLQEHLRILSALYGVLKPMDPVKAYRLEMQARVFVAGSRDLYDYWGSRLCRHLYEKDHVILNLASEEYAKAIRRHKRPGDRFVEVKFAERAGDRLVEKGVHVKMARGSMVHCLARKKAEEPEAAKEFEELGFRFSEEESRKDCYVFIKESNKAGGKKHV